MQSGNNAIRPTSADGNGVWIGSNSESPQPQPQSIVFTDVKKTVYTKKSKKRLERLLLIAAIVIFLLFLALCITIYFVAEMGEKGNVCFTPDCVKAAATLLNSINFSVSPCDNFYAFACGNWRKLHPAPEPVFIHNWFQDSFKIQKRDAIDYLEKEDSDQEPNSVHEARLVYRTCLDFESMEGNGLEALWDLLDELGLPKNPLTKSPLIQPWTRTIAKVRRYLAVDLLVGTGVLASLQNSTLNQLVIAIPEDEQILPSSRYKWKWDDKVVRERLKKKIKDEGEQIVKGWKKYATKIIEYVIKAADSSVKVTADDLNDAAYTLLDFQRELLLLEENDKVKESVLNEFSDVYTLEQVQFIMDNATNSGASKLRWKEYFEAIYEDISDDRLEFNLSEPIMVRSVPYIELLSQLVQDTDDKAIELLIWWNVIYAVAAHVNEDLKELKEVFVKKILQVPSANTRKEVCMETVSTLMRSAVGYQVKEYADVKMLTQVREMLQTVRSSFANFIYALDWMDEPTKYATVEKLYKMNMYVGYPDWYNNMDIMNSLYTNVTLTNTTHLKNILNLLNEDIHGEFAALDYINNSSRDFFDPLDVNAYYDPSGNSITVPYGILQQPYYKMGLQALNYGAIGTILGHEMTHGLDNTGRMYDQFGNYRVWWSNYSSEEYMKRETCYKDAYNKFHLESVNSNVNGLTTLGENIADDGGVRDSLAAYRSYVKKHGREAKLPGFLNYTHDQLFFLSFANMWCSEYSNEALKRTLDEDEHSPNFVRVIVVLQNFYDFSESWNCPKGSYMNPDKKCKLWE